jgi:predicted permease
MRQQPPKLLFQLLLRLQPPEFRARHGEELLSFYREAWANHAAGRNLFTRVVVSLRLVGDALRSGFALRLRRGGATKRTLDSRRGLDVESWFQDIRWSARSLRRRPGFALVVVLTLALGVGANTAVFGVLNAVLLTPLPYEEPGRLVRLYDGEDRTADYLSLPALLHFRENSRTLELGAMYTYNTSSADLTDGDRPERVRVLPASADYFTALRVRPIAGRTFLREEETDDASIVILSEHIYRRYFDGRPDAIGKTLTVDGVPRTVIGVLPAGFEDPVEGEIDIFLPLNLPASFEPWQWDNHYLSAIGRLRPGATLSSARAEIAELRRRQRELSEAVDQPAALLPLHDDVVGNADTMLVVLMSAVALLLLIACVNIASLFLARGSARATELAVQAALGSPRRRMVRQLLSESIMLATAGGFAGILLAIWIGNTLTGLAPSALRLERFALDVRIFGFALAAALIAGLLSGVAPALRFTRPGLDSVLRESGRSRAAGRSESRARNILVVAQLSLAMVLLIGAGVLMKSFDRLRNVNLNLDPTNVVTFQIHLPNSRYGGRVPGRSANEITGSAADRVRFHHQLHERIAALPGVRAIGAVSRPPVTGVYHSWGTRRLFAVGAGDEDAPFISANHRTIEGDYFGALRIPLIKGRLFGPEDHAEAPPRVIVNEALVRALFPTEDPLGQRVRGPGTQDGAEIIGVVADVPITARGVIVPMVYHSHTQFADNRNWGLTQVVALASAQPGFLDIARRELAAVDPALVLYEPRPLAEIIGRDVAQERFAMLLLTAFAGLAILLAGVGIYGVLAYSVSRRRPEIGIRMALGARNGDVQRMILNQGARLAALSIVLGVAGALALTRWLSSLVFEVSVTDPWVFATCAIMVFTIALFASGIPALAATRVDPLETMRRE